MLFLFTVLCLLTSGGFMSESVFVFGGCRSGKSRYALGFAEEAVGKKYFIATLQPGDDEMKERIRRHKEERGESWKTIEEPLQIPDAVREASKSADCIVVDCLTLWISNMMMAEYTEEEIRAQADDLCTSIAGCTCSIILVSNEVGTGVVPESRLGRDFRDYTGMINQKIASVCEKVVLMKAGIPIVIKGQ